MPSIERIRPHWEILYPHIQHLIDETGQHDLMPEDVFHWCESGKAFLVLSSDGFVIATVDKDPVTDVKELLIWFAHAFELGGDCVSRHMDYFYSLAKELDCRYISTKTAIDPVGEHLVERGWERGLTEYRTAVR